MTRFAQILVFLFVSVPSSAQRAPLTETSQHSLPNSAVQALIPAAAPSSATVPLIFEDNRVFVELSFRRPDGSFRKARVWVDTGGDWFAITERVASDIGAPFESDEQQAVDIASPAVYLGDLRSDLASARIVAILGSDRISPGVDAEAFLPARVLMHYQAVFDYAVKKFTLAARGHFNLRADRYHHPSKRKQGFHESTSKSAASLTASCSTQEQPTLRSPAICLTGWPRTTPIGHA